MDKGLTVPKWVLVVWPKILQMLQNLSAQFVCPSPKVLDFNEKRLHWASVVMISVLTANISESGLRPTPSKCSYKSTDIKLKIRLFY